MSADNYRVQIPDAAYFQAQVNCRAACPVCTNAGGHVALIAEGQFDRAYAEARRPNPLASICGRICAHPCESACRRKEIDEPISIRALKRFVTTQFGVEAPRPTDIRAVVDHPGSIAGQSGKHVAVIGAGPAGLSCAHDLALLGHRVTIYEAAPVPGGMLYLGIPEYRLPRELLLQEVRFIESLGVTILLNTRIGQEIEFEQLVRDHDAVFIGAGCMKGRGLTIEGHQLDGVLKAVDFLLNVNLGYQVNLGERVVVIGGGNVAFDVARSAARYGGTSTPGEPDHHAMMDVARLAARSGARQVTLVSLEREAELPADPEEIGAGRDEGIELLLGRGPNRIVGANGRVSGLETLDVASVFDERGRFAPTFVENSQRVIEADTIIMAIGQQADFSFLGERHRIELTGRGLFKLQTPSYSTTRPGVYAGGDIAFGPRIAIEAVADGRRAALEIHQYLGFPQREDQSIEIQPLELPKYQLAEGRRSDGGRALRLDPPVVPLDRRVGITEVELTYDTPDACQESTRCLHCWVAPVFDSDRCVLCGGCVDVCPEACLKIVPLDQLERTERLAQLLRARYGDGRAEGSAIIKDETACIRCGLCAERCPADAITMQSFTTQGDLIHD